MLITETDQKNRLAKLVEAIEIPRSYYERAVARYESIGGWLCREEATTARYSPSVSPQGSFRLGLVNRPIGPKEEYDLDLVCEFSLLSKGQLSQERLKEILGEELVAYAQARGIIEPVTESKRCWRIDYADQVKFHIDNLPCLPEDAGFIAKLVSLGVDPTLAQAAIALTCREHPDYKVISSNWPTGNPSGYAQWFEGRFGLLGLEKRRLLVEAGTYAAVDDVPAYALKTPLQQAIQVLKRHRDLMFFTDPKLKPISIALTTVSALAYHGERDLLEAITGILQRMPQFVQSNKPRVPNPVNPAEDFADKWTINPALEENFWNWYEQAVRDFEALTTLGDADELQKLSESRFGVALRVDNRAPAIVRNAPRVTPVTVIENGPKPWARNA